MNDDPHPPALEQPGVKYCPECGARVGVVLDLNGARCVRAGCAVIIEGWIECDACHALIAVHAHAEARRVGFGRMSARLWQYLGGDEVLLAKKG